MAAVGALGAMTLVTAGVGVAGAAFGLDAPGGAKAPATPPASAPPRSAVTRATGPDPVPGTGAVPSPGPEAVPSAATQAAGNPVTDAPAVATPAAATPPGPGHVEVLHLAAPGESGLRDVWVYRPVVPDSSSLPVVYFLHGVPGNAADVFNAGLAKALDRDIAAGGTPMVVVSPDGNGSHHDDTEWANAADGTDQVESFVTDVVIPTVEGAHPRDQAHRAIAGFSMGGYGAMNIALRNRDLFGQVASVAGYFHIDDPARMFGRDAAVESANRPLDHVNRAVGLRILLIDGNHDTDPVVAGESQRFASALERAGIMPELDIVPGGHDWQMVSSQFPTLLRFLDAGW